MKPFYLGDLCVPVPVIQGGMGVGVSLSGLSSAVANMGGIGVISSVAIGLTDSLGRGSYAERNISRLREEIRKARAATRGILGVNIMTVISDFSEMVRTSIEERIDVLFCGAGLPLNLPSYLGEGPNPRLVPIVSSGRAASLISQKWYQNYGYVPDGFVVEGPNAGGHLGFKPGAVDAPGNSLDHILTDVLEVTRALEARHKRPVPVIAAGGIFSGEDAYHYIQKGASGVQLGTRFAATEECDASLPFKMAFVNAQPDQIKVIKSPVGLPGRALFNNFLKEALNGDRRPSICKHRCIKTCNPKTTLFCIADALISACKGEFSNGFAFSGSEATRVTHISTVKQVFESLKTEYFKAKSLSFGH